MTSTVAGAAVAAPDAPAGWGRPVTPEAMARYLDEMAVWRNQRRRELDVLDEAALTVADPAVTGDVTLAMAMWQSAATRVEELVRVWDGGRVGAVELARLSTMVWGRTSAEGGVSLPEACRLSDAVTAQLRHRLALTTGAADVTARLTDLRAGVERIRDLLAGARGAAALADAARLERLDRRLTDVVERARRGADVGGLLGPLGTDVATCERDLIVAAARARDDARDHARAVQWRGELAGRAAQVRALVAECVAQVTPAPVLGVPDVDALGPVPDDPQAVDAYLERLGTVERALAHVADVYGAPVAELAGLRGLLEASDAQAAARGAAALPEVTALARVGAQVAGTPPVDLVRLRGIVSAYRVLIETPRPARPAPETSAIPVRAVPAAPPSSPSSPSSPNVPGRSS
ncbi:hypothetical protein [Cellulomonas sp. Marseille-Q8402]